MRSRKLKTNAATEAARTQQANNAAPKRDRLRFALILGALGPGLLAAIAGTDAGGVATYSNGGSLFGFEMLWTCPVMCFFLIIAQETAARMGCVTGKGFAGLIREEFGVRLSFLAMGALLVSNSLETLSEFAGVASGMSLFGVPPFISVPIAGIAVWLLTLSGSYKRVEKILLTLACILVAYVIAGFLVQPDWGDAAYYTFVPHIEPTPTYLALLMANIGTTIAPWMIFFQQSNVVGKNAGPDSVPYQRIDTCVGAIVASAISWFILLATGATLFPAHVGEIQDAAQAAMALTPLAGNAASTLFGLGLVGASLLGACVLPGITSSAICEAFGWEEGPNHSFKEAPAYHIIISVVLVFSVIMVLNPMLNLFDIMMVAQVVNGVLLPILMIYMVKIASDKRVMGAHRNSKIWTGLTWFAIVAIVCLTITLFVMQFLGLA